MTDPAAPKKSGPLQWILVGCGVMTLLRVLGMGGCASVFYLIYKDSDRIAAVGADYVRSATPIEQTVGTPIAVKRDWLGWNVRIVNDAGKVYFTYTVSGPRATGKAEVWLDKSGGQWTPSGARFQPASEDDEIRLGTIPRGRPFGNARHFGKTWND